MNDISVLVTGDPINGFTFYGPFNTPTEAIDAAERWEPENWWVARLWPDNGEEDS